MFGRKLQFFAVYRNPEQPDAALRYRFVSDGLSWFAFFLPLIWALSNRMWLLSVLLLTLYIGGGTWLGESPAFLIMQCGVHLFIALSAADLEGFKLRKRGWQFEGVVAARTIEQSRQRYFDQHALAL